VLSGKAEDGRAVRGAHLHAHYLSLPERVDLSGRRSGSLVVWAPGGLGQSELAALTELTMLNSNRLDGLRRPVTLTASGDVSEVAPEVVDPKGAVSWVSVTPYSPVHHHKGELESQLLADVRLELRHRGLPAAAAIELIRGPWLQYGRYRPGAERIRQQRRAYGLRVTLEEPISGPLVLGQLSHFGLGLFRPEQVG
jgi:CRISPR-associated protein Csb2